MRHSTVHYQRTITNFGHMFRMQLDQYNDMVRHPVCGGGFTHWQTLLFEDAWKIAIFIGDAIAHEFK